MISAFGIEHGVVVKRDDERAKHYGRMAATTGTMGGIGTALGVGAGGIGVAEARGRDPMSYAIRDTPEKPPLSQAAKRRVLKIPAKSHGKQAVASLGAGLAAGGIAAAYKHKQKKELAKRDTKQKWQDAGLGAATVGATGGAVHVARTHGRHMNEDAKFMSSEGKNARNALHNIQHGLGGDISKPEHKPYWQSWAKAGRKVSAVKRPAAAATVAAAGAGALGAGELARYHAKQRKLK